MESECVYCAVRTEILNVFTVNFRLQVVLWLRQLVAGVSPWRPGFDPRSFRVRFMVEWCHWYRFLSEYFGFPCQYHSTSASYSSSFNVALTRRTNGWSLGTFLKIDVFFRKSRSSRLKVFSLFIKEGRAMAQAVGRRPLTAEARSGPVHLRTVVDKVALGQVFVQVL